MSEGKDWLQRFAQSVAKRALLWWERRRWKRPGDNFALALNEHLQFSLLDEEEDGPDAEAPVEEEMLEEENDPNAEADEDIVAPLPAVVGMLIDPAAPGQAELLQEAEVVEEGAPAAAPPAFVGQDAMSREEVRHSLDVLQSMDKQCAQGLDVQLPGIQKLIGRAGEDLNMLRHLFASRYFPLFEKEEEDLSTLYRDVPPSVLSLLGDFRRFLISKNQCCCEISARLSAWRNNIRLLSDKFSSAIMDETAVGAKWSDGMDRIVLVRDEIVATDFDEFIFKVPAELEGKRKDLFRIPEMADEVLGIWPDEEHEDSVAGRAAPHGRWRKINIEERSTVNLVERNGDSPADPHPRQEEASDPDQEQETRSTTTSIVKIPLFARLQSFVSDLAALGQVRDLRSRSLENAAVLSECSDDLYFRF